VPSGARDAAISIHLLADLPHLIEPVGRIRWRQWGRPPEPVDPTWWIETTAREAGRDGLPITFVAVDGPGRAVGAAGLGEFDLAEIRDRSPWVLGMVVQADCRGWGVGRRLLTRIEDYAARHGYLDVWVATGGPAVRFYQRCGWWITETVRQASGEEATVLRKTVAGHPD